MRKTQDHPKNVLPIQLHFQHNSKMFYPTFQNYSPKDILTAMKRNSPPLLGFSIDDRVRGHFFLPLFLLFLSFFFHFSFFLSDRPSIAHKNNHSKSPTRKSGHKFLPITPRIQYEWRDINTEKHWRFWEWLWEVVSARYETAQLPPTPT